MDDMFSGVVATGAYAFTPVEHEFIGTPDVLGTEHVSNSGEGPCQIQRDVESTCASKWPRVEKRKKGAAFVRSRIEKLAESCIVKPAASQDTSVEGCLQILNTHVEVKAGKKLYIVLSYYKNQFAENFFMKLDA